jgi:peptide deformylase
VLRTCCDAVDRFGRPLIGLVADLEETVSGPGRAGLAANQIGVSRRVFAYNVDGRVGHLVNPVIEVVEGEQEGERQARPCWKPSESVWSFGPSWA